jgi:hypothetical protein
MANEVKEVQVVKNSKFQDAMEEVNTYIKSRIPIIWVQTHEETRFIYAFIDQVAIPAKRDTWVWSSFRD